MPQCENFSSLSDMEEESTSGQFKRASKAFVSEMSQSMMDLSVLSTDTDHDEKGVPWFNTRVSVFALVHTLVAK